LNTNNPGQTKSLIEKGEDFFKNKNKDIEKIKLFEESNFLKCNTRDYSKVINHRKTNDFKPKISSSFYQKIDNPKSSRSDGKTFKNKNFTSKNKNIKQRPLISFNIENKSLEKSFENVAISTFNNLKTENFTLKNAFCVRSNSNDKLNKSIDWEKSIDDKKCIIENGNNLTHRRTKSLDKQITIIYNEVENGFDDSKKKEENFNVNIIKKNNKNEKKNRINSKENIECLKERIDKAPFLDFSKFYRIIIYSVDNIF